MKRILITRGLLGVTTTQVYPLYKCRIETTELKLSVAGMGLRKLITRSNPPLEVLDMDLSDMRSKDFTWCFDRLSTLRRFRITGSDMSDRVIDLFKPVFLPRCDGVTPP